MTARRLPLLLVVLYAMLAAFLASFALAIVNARTPGGIGTTSASLAWWPTPAAFFILLAAARARIISGR